LVLEALWIALRRLGDWRTAIPETVAFLLALSIVYLIAVRYGSIQTPPRGLVALFAIAFRLTVAGQPPSLSDDLFRYQWEGRVVRTGGNPYLARPNDPAWAHIPAHPRAPGRDFPSIYGPLVQYAQALAVEFPKLPAIAADCATLAVLAFTAPAGWLIYAWSPLAVVEFWGQGHNDALLVLFLTLALVRPAQAGWWIGLAAAVKWWPLILVRAFRFNARQTAIAIAVVGALALPFVAGFRYDNARFATGFLAGWRNNDSVFGVILWAVGDPQAAKYIAFAFVAALFAFVRNPMWAAVGLLAVSANVHPWYLTWLLPFLVFRPAPVLLLWIALAPLSYETAIWWATLGEWRQSDWVRWAIYAPVALGLVISGARKSRLTGPGAPLE